MKKYMPYLAIGFEVTAFLLLGYYIGQHLDRTFLGAGLYTALGLFGGLILWVIRIVLKNRRDRI